MDGGRGASRPAPNTHRTPPTCCSARASRRKRRTTCAPARSSQRDIGERFFEAELLRHRGQLAEFGVLDEPEATRSDGLSPTADAPDASAPSDRQRIAERFYRRAIDVAESQHAKLFTLRAASNLARLLESQGRQVDADAVLRPVYGWFTEGFEFPDLRRARALLD